MIFNTENYFCNRFVIGFDPVFMRFEAEYTKYSVESKGPMNPNKWSGGTNEKSLMVELPYIRGNTDYR